MEKKSLESHQVRRTAANFQRENTASKRLLKETLNQVNSFPKVTREIAKLLHSHGKLVIEKKAGFYYVSLKKKDNNGEVNTVEVAMSDTPNNQNLRIEPQGEHQWDYYYSAKMVADDKLLQETEDCIKFLETGKLPETSSLKRKDTANMYDFTTETELAKKGFDQKKYEKDRKDNYNKILAEEGEEEAAKYEKGLRGVTK